MFLNDRCPRLVEASPWSTGERLKEVDLDSDPTGDCEMSQLGAVIAHSGFLEAQFIWKAN